MEHARLSPVPDRTLMLVTVITLLASTGVVGVVGQVSALGLLAVTAVAVLLGVRTSHGHEQAEVVASARVHAEGHTAGELGRLRRAGWRVLRDEPHHRQVAVGAGGAIVIESRWQATSPTEVEVRDAVRHARRAHADVATRVGAPVTSVVVFWCESGTPLSEVVDGVTVLSGGRLAGWLGEQAGADVLSPRQVADTWARAIGRRPEAPAPAHLVTERRAA